MRKTILLPLLLISTMTQAAELFIFNDTLNSSWNVFQGEAVKDANGSIAGIGTYSCFSNLTFSKKDFEVITLAKTVRATEIHTQNTIVGSMVDLRRFKAREVYIAERKSDKGLIIARAYFPKVDGVEQVAVISPWGRLECGDTNTPCGLRYGDFIHTTSGQYRVLE